MTWWQGSKGRMTSRFAALTVRPAGWRSLYGVLVRLVTVGPGAQLRIRARNVRPGGGDRRIP
ncbi:hypothetical protein STVIR_4488 [Streptomyces viridochromogenes Tue57]|uniref:Uncharacterized protein n=1 Tax=Streptomyces viridochromogenes Tue57 TaxID=1160705 RepID=L8PGR3_STRVR|nr:hypothetical protein STVIR_4488 [Streptomyces viridochromogenes Tue57]